VLSDRRTQMAGSLSGGEQQMLAVSRALMSNPRVLLVDELSMGLAPLVVTGLLNALANLCEQGLGVVVVDQSGPKLIEHADRAYLLEKGRIVWSGSSQGLAELGEEAAILGYAATEGNGAPTRAAGRRKRPVAAGR
jgi:branched-chain amino acid transport system ATP-binding protein